MKNTSLTASTVFLNLVCWISFSVLLRIRKTLTFFWINKWIPHHSKTSKKSPVLLTTSKTGTQRCVNSSTKISIQDHDAKAFCKSMPVPDYSQKKNRMFWLSQNDIMVLNNYLWKNWHNLFICIGALAQGRGMNPLRCWNQTLLSQATRSHISSCKWIQLYLKSS